MAHGKVSEADLAIGPPFPAAKPDDVEDVSWALSTAEANWNRGDHADAIKWIRRAAEAAAEAEADDRALELAKAAADLASLIVHAPAPKLDPAPKPAPAQSASPAANKPSAPPAPTHASGMPPGKQVSAQPEPLITRTGAPTGTNSPSGKPPAGPRAQAPQASLPKVVPASRAGERRAGRKSAHNLEAHRPKDDGEEEDPDVTRAVPVPSTKRLSGTNEGRRRGRSKPAVEELTQTAVVPASVAQALDAAAAAPPPSTGRSPHDEPTSPRAPLPSATDEIDEWPTQSLSNDEITNLTDDSDGARSNALTPLEISRTASTARKAEPGVPTSQAMHVVVWRSVDGVHVAPAGTRVSAITIDAMLVALDPSADLAAWLIAKK